MAGLHLCGTDRVHHCGASATTRGGGQPLHPIFALRELDDYSTETGIQFPAGTVGKALDRLVLVKGADITKPLQGKLLETLLHEMVHELQMPKQGGFPAWQRKEHDIRESVKVDIREHGADPGLLENLYHQKSQNEREAHWIGNNEWLASYPYRSF